MSVPEIEYASVPNGKYSRETFSWSPKSFLDSICRAELGPASETGNMIDDFFRISQRGSTIGKEFIAGLTIFFTIAYVLTTNSIILEPTGLKSSAVFFSTTLASGIFTYLMGLVCNLPVVLGPSLSLNILFAQIAKACPENPNGDIDGRYTIQCSNWGVTTLPWSDALGAVFLSGWFYAFFTFCGLRGYLYEIVPKSLRSAITVGTGFYITTVGLKIGHISRVTVRAQWIPEVFAGASCDASVPGFNCQDTVDLNTRWYNHGIANFFNDPYACIAVLGIVFAVVLEMFKVPGSLIISIWLATFVGINMYKCNSQTNHDDDSITQCVTDLNIWTGDSSKIPFIADNDWIPAARMSFKYAKTPFFWQCVFSFLFFELFDSFGALTGIVSRMGDAKDHPTVAVDRVNRAMVIDSFGVWLGAIIGCNSISVYIESNTGVEVGGRTGLTAIVTGSCLLLCMLFIYPFVAIIPPCATTCALLMVGVYTVQEFHNIDTSDYIQLFSAFVTIAIMGFTFSITNGICIGFIFYCWLQLVACGVTKLSDTFPAYFGWIKLPDTISPELPHPLMIVFTCFMAAHFELLKQQ